MHGAFPSAPLYCWENPQFWLFHFDSVLNQIYANSVSICIQIPIYPAAVQLGPFSLSISEEKSKNNCYLYILPKHSRILYAVLTPPFFLSSPSFLYEEMLEQTD